METIRVRAVEGALVPHPDGAHLHYVGWRRAREEERPEHVFGRTTVGLVRTGFVEVPKTSTIERAIARGELVVEESEARTSPVIEAAPIAPDAEV